MLASLRDQADHTNRDLILILYLRNQIDYWDSLFHEMIKHGDGRAYGELAAEILATGCYRFRESVHQFDYDRILGGLVDWGGADIVVRNYHTLVGGSIITDFAALLGLGDRLRPRPGHATGNRRLTTAESLTLFYQNRVGRPVSPVESARIRHIAAQALRPTMSPALRQRVIDRFAEGNRRARVRFGLETTGLDLMPPPSSDAAPSLDEIFSFEIQCLIADGTLPADSLNKASSRYAAWTTGLNTAAAELQRAESLWHHNQRAKRALRHYTRRIITPLRRGILFAVTKQ